MASIPEGESCASCAFMIEKATGPKPDAPKQYFCQRYPPHVALVTAHGPKTPANPEGVYVGTRGDFAPVHPSFWCGEWAEAETGLGSAPGPGFDPASDDPRLTVLKAPPKG